MLSCFAIIGVEQKNQKLSEITDKATKVSNERKQSKEKKLKQQLHQEV